MSRPDKEEQEILDAFDAGELQRAPDVEDRKARHQQYAEAIPYQTLVASILHKYVEGRLHEDR